MSTAALAPSASGVNARVPSKSVVVGALMPLVYLLFGVTWMSMIPLMAEVTSALSVEKKDGTLLVTIISMAKSIVPILAGLVAARVGLTRTMRFAVVLILVGGVAPWVTSYSAALAARFVFGVGGAIWVTLMGSVVLSALTPSQRPIANALNGIAVNVGVVAALYFTIPVSQSIGAQWTLTIGTIGTALCLLALVAVGSLDAPRPVGAAAPPVPAVLDQLRAYIGTLKVGATWWLAIAFCGPLALYLVLNTFLGTHLEAQFQVPRLESMRWMSFMNLWGVPASLAAGLLMSKLKVSPRPFLVVASLVLPVAVYGAVHADSPTIRAVAFACAGFALFLPTAPLVTAVQKLPGQTAQRLGMIFGTMFAVTYLVSAAVPTLVGDVVANGMALGTALSIAALLGSTPLAGLLLASEK